MKRYQQNVSQSGFTFVFIFLRCFLDFCSSLIFVSFFLHFYPWVIMLSLMVFFHGTVGVYYQMLKKMNIPTRASDRQKLNFAENRYRNNHLSFFICLSVCLSVFVVSLSFFSLCRLRVFVVDFLPMCLFLSHLSFTQKKT
jgi:hypothetical protein